MNASVGFLEEAREDRGSKKKGRRGVDEAWDGGEEAGNLRSRKDATLSLSWFVCKMDQHLLS